MTGQRHKTDKASRPLFNNWVKHDGKKMYEKKIVTRQTSYLWLFIGALVFIDACGCLETGITLSRDALLVLCLPPIGLLTLSVFYSRVRKIADIALATNLTAATLAFMAASCLLSYLVISFKAPLIDAYLLAFDRSLGLDWLEFYKWVSARPVLWIGMKLVYMLLIPQIFICELFLTFQKQFARARETLWLFMLICLGCVVVSGFLPAEGTFAVFHVETGEPYLQEFAALRQGTFKFITLQGGLKGIVTFPSLHMALALLFPYVVRGIRVVFPVFLIINILIILTTPIVGGHHFSDLFGGALLTLLVILVWRAAYSTSFSQEEKA